ncbi:MAG: peroxidase [Saprospiraceae bacterium]|nr:peroxidase [Saprospiraceae bacterium]
MEVLELNDIQAYVIHDYDKMIFSRHVLLRVNDKESAKKWIAGIACDITHAIAHPETEENHHPQTALNIAFTATGLEALGLHDDNIKAFSREFREGMDTPHRRRMLGDSGNSSPDTWSWGNATQEPVHILLMVFGINEEVCLNYFEKLQSEYLALGLSEGLKLDGQTLENNKEHFGFRDGISQPVMYGSGIQGPKNDMVQPGEFIMGYQNEYKVYPQSPLIMHEQGEINLLPADAAQTGKKDLGKNGTYLVIRQMDQDVDAFWSFMNENTKNEDGSVNALESTKLASKMLGRWPGGASVTKFPDRDPGFISNDNDCGYAKNDAEGMKCPFGSHLRRANPRDSFEDNGAKLSVTLSNRHRIIRRARLYGEPIIGSPTNHKPSGPVGILFNCFNADISRQYEFVQFTWANSPKVKELYNDPDPFIGAQESSAELQQNFTIQSKPVSKTITGLQRFVTIRGGSYFFFPSITAIRYISTI